MTKRHRQVGVILGAFLIAVVIMALPRVAAAWGGFSFGFHSGRHHHTFRRTHAFVHPYRDFVSRHRFFDFTHGFHRRHFRHHRFRHQGFHHRGHFRQPHGFHHGKTVTIFRR